jgi:hypothetical protein
MPTLGVFVVDIEKHGIGITCLDKPYIGANQCGGFLFLLIGPMKMSQTALLSHLTADIEKHGIGITCLDKPHHRCTPVWGFLLPWSARSGMSVSLEERRFGPIPDHPHDVLLGPLKHRCRNQQGIITCEMYLPKCIGNAKPKTNQTILV